MSTILTRVIAEVSQVILGKEQTVRLSLACMLSRGHLLIEDLPGVGKTTLAHVLARLLNLRYQRIQFTSDLLPADIIGVNIFNRSTEDFRFQPGPIFAQLILADEINRATPKAQSALLEAMEEHQVTIDGTTRPLPEPFFVIATQNPQQQIGTFPLPESQLDRFLMRVNLGYPDPHSERLLLRGRPRKSLLERLQPCLRVEELRGLQEQVESVHVSEALLDYVQDLLAFTRQSGEFQQGLSPRAGLALLHAAQAWALLAGRAAVLPEDVQAVAVPVMGHRLQSAKGEEGEWLIQERLLRKVPVP